MNRFRKMRLTVCVAMMLAPVCLGPFRTALGQSPFAYFRVDASLEPASFGDANWIDLDRDGDQDVLVVASIGAGSRVPATRMYEQLSTTAFLTDEGVRRATAEYRQRAVLNAPDLWLADVDWGDYDLDGDLDAVVSGTQQTTGIFAPSIRILVNDGAGTFVAGTPEGVVPVLGTVAWADVDNDGDVDLLTMGRTSSGATATTIYRNRNGSFFADDVVLPALAFGDADWADVDRDGDLDVGLCGVKPDGTMHTSLYLNESGLGFTELDFGADGLAYCSIRWGDYDQDGFPDLLVSGGRPSHLVLGGVTRIYHNENGRGLLETPFELEGVVAGSAEWVDVDNDGALDVVASGGTDLTFGRAATRIYRNEGDDFRHISNITGTFPGRMDPGDFDGDGDLDLLMVGLDREGMAISTILMNGELLANSPPSPPSDLQASVSGGRAALSWSSGADEQTAQSGLTYNLRVGTEPGIGDVMSVAVDEGGRPVRSEPGNVSSNTSWTLSDLSNGTYYWSVQSLDNSYSPSTFSSVESFDVTTGSGTKPVADESVPGVPDDLSVGAPYPNPTSGRLIIPFDLPHPMAVRLEVFDSLGRHVISLVDGNLPAGSRTAVWDGRDAGGGMVATGLYLVRLTADNESVIQTVALVR